jgi:allantoicase
MTMLDLASERLGARVLAVSDDFFAAKERLLKAAPPVFLEGKYTTRGKWMDGWETRRRRTPGHDWSVIRLAFRGIIRECVIDTSYFKANNPEQCSIEGFLLEGRPDSRRESRLLNDASTGWSELLPRSRVTGNTLNRFSISSLEPWSHLRLRIYPDGGVARLHVYGEASPESAALSTHRAIDLGALRLGASILSSSDEFYGSPINLLMPGRSKNMGDGWETRRRRGPGHDWVIIKLGVPGVAQQLEIDTTHFKGNFPESCSMEGALIEPPGVSVEASSWQELLPRMQLGPNKRHIVRRQIHKIGGISHIRLNIFPDGGLSRLRIFGTPLTGNRP